MAFQELENRRLQVVAEAWCSGGWLAGGVCVYV